MTFDQAFAATKVGGRVRRADWDSERFLRFDKCLLDEMGHPYMQRPSDVTADNWEMLQ